MKRTLLIIAAFTFLSTVNAQEKSTNYNSKISLGLKIGANYSNVYDTQGENFVADGKFGIAGGAFVAIPLGKYIGIQPELLFSQKGFKGSGRLLGSNYNYTRTTNYLDIPLLFVLKPSEKIAIVLGPQYSYLLSEKNVFTSAVTNATQEQEFNNDNVRKNTFCFIGGLDVNLSSVVLGLRAGWDLKQNNGDGTSTTPRYKNMWYQATIGCRL